MLSLTFFFVGYILQRLSYSEPNPGNYTLSLEEALQEQEQKLLSYIDDQGFVSQAINKELTFSELEDLSNALFSIYIYKTDSLVFWSSNRILPFKSEIETDYKGPSLKRLKNGFYDYFQRSIRIDNVPYTLVGLIPVKYFFSFQNEYVKNQFALQPDIPSFIFLSNKPTKFAVYNYQKEPLFYLAGDGVEIIQKNKGLILFIYLLGVIAFALLLNNIAVSICKKRSAWMGVAFLVLSVFILRVLSVQLNLIQDFRALELFNPRHFASSDLMGSLGDFLINVVLFLWLSVFFHRFFRIKHLRQKELQTKYTLSATIYFVIIAGIFALSSMFKSLALNSGISLEINNVFSLSVYSILGLFGLSVLLMAFFLFSHRIMHLFVSMEMKGESKFIFLFAAVGIFTLLNLTNAFDVVYLILLFFSVGYILLFELFIKAKELTLTWVTVWLIIMASLSSFLLFSFNKQRNINYQKIYASKLAEEIDIETEFQFDAVYKRILSDKFIELNYNNPFTNRKEFERRIDKRYIGSYLFNRYDYSIHLYSKNNIGLKGEKVPYEEFKTMIDQSSGTSNPYLFFWTDETKTAYIARLPIKKEDQDLGQMVLYFKPKNVKVTNVYPALLLDDRLKSAEVFEQYNFAIYQDGKRIDQSNPQYSPTFNYPSLNEEEYRLVEETGQRHIIYRASAKKYIVVSKDKDSMIKPFSLFSYLFVLQFIVILVLGTINFLARVLPSRSFQVKWKTGPTLRNKINISFLAVILISFVVIGVITLLYFKDEFRKYHEGRLDRKVRGVLATASNEIKEMPDTLVVLPDVNKLAEIHNMDVNLYNDEGDLIALSQQEILERGLVSTKMHPLAFNKLVLQGEERYTHDEKIMALKYKTAYRPLKNNNEDILGYIGLPYYSGQGNLSRDVSEFMGAMLNVYVLLFLITVAIALAIGNSVTRPLTAIGEKLRKFKLGEKNKPLVWKNEDEIGTLINQYNKMILELEHSADLLAQSNREMAWREMAKQVAHEIKNPLTPMKLSIQYLEKAVKSNPEDVAPLVSRVSATLLEQIESLSHIASEFSNFAKMPTATNEKFVLNHLVSSVFDLFSERDNIEISLEMEKEELVVLADKKQLVRVYNNLLKNAIQAIPEDRQGTIVISLEQHGNMAITKVVDNGMGIPEDKYESVFVPNFTTKNSGMGLGLAISRNIVESALGKIYFDSEVNVGTTFFVELPIIAT